MNYLELRQKLLSYRLERSHEPLQINLCNKSHTVIKNWHLISKEREFFEDLVEKYLSYDGWYLKPRYKLTNVDKNYFNYDTITKFTMKRTI